MTKLLYLAFVLLFFTNVHSQCIPPTTPVAWNNGPVCSGAQLQLFAANYLDATYSWAGPNGFTSTQREPVINNASLTDAGLYSVIVTVNGCSSAPGSTTVVMKATPLAPIASNNGPICSGQTLNLTASDVAGATYTWVGQSGFTSGSQNPAINTATVNDGGIYLVVATVNGCNSSSSATNVVVKQTPPQPIATNNGPVCSGTTLTIFTSTIPGAIYNWTGPNSFTSSVQNPVINNVSLSDAGSYSVVAELNGCASISGSTTVSVQQTVGPTTVSTNSPLCEGSTLNLTTPSVAGVTYNWTGPNGFTSSVQDPVIANVSLANAGNYTLTITGCNSITTTTSVVVNPAPAAPTANNNAPLCIGQTLNLTAISVAGATYKWNGPNGFTSAMQNPVISNTSLIDSGSYKVIATVNGCSSTQGSTSVSINDSARANAGNNLVVCADNIDVKLSGVVNGGSASGIWSTTGSGTFSPNNTSLNAAYVFSNSDKSTGSVTLSLISANNGACPASTSSILITIPSAITVSAGVDQSICGSDNSITLSGQVTAATGGLWKTSGTGTFSPGNTDLNARYLPSANDKAKGLITLTLSSTGNGTCSAVSDAALLTINPGPQVNAGTDRSVMENEFITLQPTITGTNLNYLWTPALYLNNNTIKNPVVTGINDQTYILTVTDGNGCSNSDDVVVSVLRSPMIPNTFTPNNDGINDTWIIKNLQKYPNAAIRIFNRYGQLVFESKGYSKPWDGTMKGKSLPFGTYYYVIEPGNGVKPFTGYITLIK